MKKATTLVLILILLSCSGNDDNGDSISDCNSGLLEYTNSSGEMMREASPSSQIILINNFISEINNWDCESDCVTSLQEDSNRYYHLIILASDDTEQWKTLMRNFGASLRHWECN